MVVRKRPTGAERRRGFADLVFIPKKHVDNPAMIIELKCKTDVDTAIKQIKDNSYITGLEGYHDKVLLVGISYDKLYQMNMSNEPRSS